MEERSEKGDASPVGRRHAIVKLEGGAVAATPHHRISTPLSLPLPKIGTAGGSSPPFSYFIVAVYLPSSPSRRTREPRKKSPPLRHTLPPTCLEVVVANQI
ncbi:hypothetical protein AHAS_Ahas06G0189100 [Arachis hypogaea]